MKKGTLIFLVPGKCVRNGKAVTPVTISRGDGDTHTFDLADRAAYGGVVAHWQDTKTPQKQTKQVAMKRKEESKQEVTNYTAGSAENVYILPTLYASKDEATRGRRGVEGASAHGGEIYAGACARARRYRPGNPHPSVWL